MAELTDVKEPLSIAEKSVLFAALNLLANHQATTKDDLKTVLSIIHKILL